MRRQNIYRSRDFARQIAETTGGSFIETEFADEFGSYWIVIWD